MLMNTYDRENLSFFLFSASVVYPCTGTLSAVSYSAVLRKSYKILDSSAVLSDAD